MVVADASALLALLRNEPGADQVREQGRGALVSAVNLAETWSRVLEDDSLLDGVCRMELEELELSNVPFDVAAAMATAQLRPLTKPLGLSLGDRACVALAIEKGLPVLTADRRWSELEIGADVRLVR